MQQQEAEEFQWQVIGREQEAWKVADWMMWMEEESTDFQPIKIPRLEGSLGETSEGSCPWHRGSSRVAEQV